mgnify:CR=1 FL=1
MKDIKFINGQLDKIIEFKPNVKYSKEYKHPKDRISDFVSNCENEEQIFDVLRLVKGKVDSEFSMYEYGDLFGVGVTYYEDYRSFHNDLMTEVDSVIELYDFTQTKDDLISVEEEIPETEKLQYRTKVILLQELGVLDFLKKKEPFKNNTHLAKMIAELIAGKDEDVTAVYNTVRTDLSYVIHRNNPKTPYTKKQIKKVNSILATFSLPQIK